jgi:hypothetical protein
MEAARQCSRCQRGWCPLCVKQLHAAGKLLEVCARCNAPLVAPSMSLPAPPMEPLALAARVLSSDGLITAAAIALPGAVSGWFGFGIGTLFNLAYWGTLIGYYFQIIAHIGDDGDGLPGASDALSDLPSVMLMTLRGALCVVVGTAPYLVWLASGGRADSAVGLLALLAGMTYLPALLVTVTLTDSTAGALYPVAWVRIVARAPRSYVHLVLLFVVTVLAAALALYVVSWLVGGIPLFGSWLRCALCALLLFAQAAVVGGFLRRHATDFGVG